jgi:hypothetical protein
VISMGMSLKILGWIVGVGFVVFAISKAQGNFLFFALYVVIVAVGYVVSLSTHPMRNCWYCKGSGRHNGTFWDYGQRPCSHCDGGRVPRLGARYFG